MLLNEQCCSLSFQRRCSTLMKQQQLFTVVGTTENNIDIKACSQLLSLHCSLTLLRSSSSLIVEQYCNNIVSKIKNIDGNIVDGMQYHYDKTRVIRHHLLCSSSVTGERTDGRMRG